MGSDGSGRVFKPRILLVLSRGFSLVSGVKKNSMSGLKGDSSLSLRIERSYIEDEALITLYDLLLPAMED
jgi:hypothetical protein